MLSKETIHFMTVSCGIGTLTIATFGFLPPHFALTMFPIVLLAGASLFSMADKETRL